MSDSACLLWIQRAGPGGRVPQVGPRRADRQARGQVIGWRGGARRRRVPSEPAIPGAGGSGGSPPGKQSGGSSPRDGTVRLQGAGQLGGAQHHVVPPAGLRVEVPRQRRHQVTLPVRVGEGVDGLGGAQAAVGVARVGAVQHLVAQREVGGQAAGQVRADLRSGPPGPEDRRVPDVQVVRVGAPVMIVGLGQPPDVVVREVVAVRLARAHLVVQRPGPLVPHAPQEVQAEPDLAGEVRAGPGAHLPGERRDALQQHGLGVAGRLHEVQVVPGVEPAPGRVDRRAGRVPGQAALEVAVAVHRRGPVGHRAGVVEVAGCAAQRGVDEVRAVPLVLEERQRVGQRPRVEVRSRADREPG